MRYLAIIVAVLMLSGCASAPVWIPPSYPQPLISAADVVAQVALYVAPEAVLRCEGMVSTDKKVCRDTFLDAVLLGADANWREYEALLFDGAKKAAEPSTLSKVLTVTAMGLGALGALSGGSLLPLAAAPYLAGAAGIIPGVQSALTPVSDPFFGRTLATIDALMVASRAEVADDILTCMDASITDCSIGRAVDLAGKLQRAGSLPGALSFAAETAAVKTATVKERLRTRMRGQR